MCVLSEWMKLDDRQPNLSPFLDSRPVRQRSQLIAHIYWIFFWTFWFLFHMWLFVKRLMIDFPRHVYLFPPFYFGNPFFWTMIWPILWANVGYVILCQKFQFVSCIVLICNFIWFGSFWNWFSWNWRRLDIRISSRYKFLIGNLTSVSYFSYYYYSIQI